MDTVNGMPRGSRGLHGVVRPAGVDTELPGAPEAKGARWPDESPGLLRFGQER